MSNVAEKIENNEVNIIDNNEKETTMENIIYKVIPVFKQYIKDNSKPAPKDETYGNKLRSFLSEYDFAVYSLLRNKDFSKGLHSNEKATDVAEVLGKRSRIHDNVNYTVNRLVDNLKLEDTLSEGEIVELKEYVVSYFEKIIG